MPEAGARRQKIKRWFWCSVFGQAYESAPNSKSAKDVTELILRRKLARDLAVVSIVRALYTETWDALQAES